MKNELTQYVVFKIGKETYAMNIEFIERIVSEASIRSIPNTNKDVLGIINIQEEIVPVVDLRSKFELKSDKEEEIPFIIVSRVQDIILGLVVDEVIEVINIESEKELGKIGGNIVGKASSYIKGIYKKETQKKENEKNKEYELIVVLDPDRLLEINELNEVQKLKEDNE